MKSYLDLLKLLPKTNCKECGEASCLLFALKVFSKNLSPEKCPYLSMDKLPSDFISKNLTFNQLIENLKYLKEKFRSLPQFLDRAKNLGCIPLPENKAVYLPYLDLRIEISLDEKDFPKEIKSSVETPLDPRDEILICNYFIFNGKSPLSYEYVGLEFFPHSISKVKTLNKYAEEPLAEFLSIPGIVIEEILKDFEIINLVKSNSGISFDIR
ncbi:MAG: (Fe-S)-binding protein, partial [Caldimicrobium sp.]